MSHERRLKAREFALEEESAAAAAAAAAGNQELEENQPVQQGGAAARPSNKSPASSLRATIKSAKSSSQVQGATKGSRTTKSSGKDRHSKVNTARGPRDRRVRLSVSTAIQFYDIQDRLGFDQPSKAIEWLLRKAKPAIDELNHQQQQQPPQQNLAVQNEGAEGSALLREDDESSRKQLEAHDYEADEPPNPGVWKLHEAAEFGRRAGTGRVSPGPEPTRANVTRDRRAVREKDKSSGSKSTTSTTSSNTASREPVFQQQQQGFGQGSSLFESLYTSPMRSSFTQLLQAPIPAAVLQGSSHSLLQNPQFLQGLYSSYGQQQQHGSSSTLQQEQQQVAHPYAMQQLVQQQQHEAGASGGFLSGLRSFGTFTPVIQVPTLASLNSTSSGMLFPHHNQMNAATAATALSGTGQRHAERNLLPFATPHQAQSHQHHQFQQLLSLEAAAAAPVAYQHAAGEQEAQHFHHHQARHFQQQDFFVPRPAATAAAAAAGALHHRRIPARIQGIDDVDGEVQQQHQQQQQQQRQQQ